MISPVIHLIEDDKGVRESLAFLLTVSGLAVRTYESANAFVASLSGIQPGCIVSDVRMPGMDGIQLLHVLKEKNVQMPAIIMTGHADVSLAVAAMKAGALDFIEKPFDDEVLLSAIKKALARYEEFNGRQAEVQIAKEKIATLSPREMEVLHRLVQGQANKVIAGDLGLSPRTVEVHRAKVMAKTGSGSLSELVRLALDAEAF